MRLLLDTHVVLWWLAGGAKLSTQVLQLVRDPANDVFLSATSVWEMAIKSALGKIKVNAEEVVTAASESGFKELPITAQHAIQVTRLPDHHRDPFDRLLVAQSLTEQMYLLTVDRALGVYGPSVIVAS